MIENQQYWTEEIGKYLSGNITPKQEEALLDWKEAKEEHRAYFEEMNSVWHITQPVNLVTEIDLDSQWELVNQKVQPGKSTGAKLRVMYRLVAAAAAIALLIFMVHSKNRGIGSNSNQPVLVSTEITTENSELTLPDGSTVTLRAGSRLTYDEKFEVRDVVLAGEGYFDVVSDPSRPFSVTTAEARVEVLGTKFNLRETPEGDVELLVDEGRVAFAGKAAAPATKKIVTREEVAIFRLKSLQVEKLEEKIDMNITSWKTGKLRFEDMPVSMVFIDLERHFEVDFEVADTTLLKCDLKADFDNASINEVIETIEFTLGWQLRRENNVYYVTGDPCIPNNE